MSTSRTPVHRSVVSGNAVAELQEWTSQVESWPAGSHIWGHYAEQTATGEVICRTENVSACHDGFRALVEGDLSELSASVLGTGVVDFKDKVNYKQPGGAGFSPHQDLPAYPGVGTVISILVAIDECTTESGCLWIAEGVDEILPTDARGVVTTEAASSLSWTPVELGPGDALCIAGLAPHYSEANKSAFARRVLVASYAPVSEKYTRRGYYSARSAGMQKASEQDGQFRISTLADFEGVEVRSAGLVATGSCTHG
jgi:hypothetical protein